MAVSEREHSWRPAAPFLFSLLALLAGCASPGAPRPPSLQLPRVPTDLTATRSGDEVDLRFTLPTHTTDGLPLKRLPLQIRFCRQERADAPCTPLPNGAVQGPLQVPPARQGSSLEDRNRLDAALLTGPPRAAAYRVEVLNAQGRSAGFSAPAYVAAGPPPPPVEQLRATPTRRGVLLQWTAVPGAGEVLLLREQEGLPAPNRASGVRPPANPPGPRLPGSHKAGGAPATIPGQLWLQADPGSTDASRTIDGSAEPGVRYQYRAVRRLSVQAGDRQLEMRSGLSAPVEAQWAAVYPPEAPLDLTAAGFTTPGVGAGAPAAYAVDLIWQPVDDPHVIGYLVSRTALDAGGRAQGSAERLNSTPVRSPSFHDSTAKAGLRYRYEVQAVDAEGNHSAPASTLVEPTAP